MIVFSSQFVIPATLKQLSKFGFKKQNWGTVIECFRNDDLQRNVYYHNEKKVFFTYDKKKKT